MRMQDEPTRKKWSRKRKVLTVFLLIMGAGFIGAAGIGAKVYHDTKNTVETIYEEIEQSEWREEAVKVEEKEPVSVLVLGVDEREHDKGRSDTMIVLTVNPASNDTKMLSIPRDTRTEIIGHGTTDKINHAYAFGGLDMSRRTVENLLGIPIDYVVQVNMESFQDIVDIVGGITIDNEFHFTEGPFDYPEGPITLNGEEALSYVRMRYDDPSGDFGRQNRQKKVIQAIAKSSLSVDTALNYRGIFDMLENNVRINVSFDELLTIQKGYQQSFKNIEQLYMNNGQGTMIDGIYYYLPDEAEMEEVTTVLKMHLAME